LTVEPVRVPSFGRLPFGELRGLRVVAREARGSSSRICRHFRRRFGLALRSGQVNLILASVPCELACAPLFVTMSDRGD